MDATQPPSRRRTDLLLRAAGLLLVAAAAAAVRLLVRLHAPDPAAPAGALGLLLAFLAFPLASGGLTLLALGAHVFDEVAVRSRWF